jgi:hypothetical protein
MTSPSGRFRRTAVKPISCSQRNDGYRAGVTQNLRDAKMRHAPDDAKIGVTVAKSFLRQSHALRRYFTYPSSQCRWGPPAQELPTGDGGGGNFDLAGKNGHGPNEGLSTCSTE